MKTFSGSDSQTNNNHGLICIISSKTDGKVILLFIDI